MRLEFTISTFLQKFLPQHKRQTSRTALFLWPLNQLISLWSDFKTWRDLQVFNVKLVPQTMVLEALLNSQVEHSGNLISVEQKTDGAVFIGLLAEDTDYIWFSTESEGTDLKEIPLAGEETGALLVNFNVYAPAACNEAEIVAILDKYVLAGYTYEIIQN